jgi:hypothetical protein
MNLAREKVSFYLSSLKSPELGNVSHSGQPFGQAIALHRMQAEQKANCHNNIKWLPEPQSLPDYGGWREVAPRAVVVTPYRRV